MPCNDWSEVWKLHVYCTVEFVFVIEALKLVTVEVESRSQTPSLWLRRRYVAFKLYALYWWPFTILCTIRYWGCGQGFMYSYMYIIIMIISSTHILLGFVCQHSKSQPVQLLQGTEWYWSQTHGEEPTKIKHHLQLYYNIIDWQSDRIHVHNIRTCTWS